MRHVDTIARAQSERMSSRSDDRTSVYPWSRALGYRGEVAFARDLLTHGIRNDWTNRNPWNPEAAHHDFYLKDSGISIDVKTRPKATSDLIFVNVNQVGGKYFVAVRRIEEDLMEVCGWVSAEQVVRCGTFADEQGNDGRAAYRVPFTHLEPLPWWKTGYSTPPRITLEDFLHVR